MPFGYFGDGADMGEAAGDEVVVVGYFDIMYPKYQRNINMGVNELYDDVMHLSPSEKLKLVDSILISLDIPDVSIVNEIKVEVQSRIEAYESGVLNAVPVQDILKRYED